MSLIMLVLLYGILEVSRLIFINSEIENAAREGARYAALHPGVNADNLRDTIYGKLTLADRNTLTISGPTYLDPGGRCSFCRVEVNLTYQWNTLVSLLQIGPLQLRARSIQLIEAP